MKHIDKVLAQIEQCLNDDTYLPLENEQLELKDMSGGQNWTEIHKTACAFLNTQDGIIIVGVNEKNGKYILKGYRADNEPKTKEIAKQFTNRDGQHINLDDYFHFEIKDFRDKQVLIIHVKELPDDEKFAFYRPKKAPSPIAYERIITGDHKISAEKIQAHKEYKQELHMARELMPVPHATLQNLDVDKLNEYIQLLNRDMKIETLKPDIETAHAFLEKRRFVHKNDVTVLGMLVCGKNLYYFLGSRCQVDCYADSLVGFIDDKKILKDNIIPLMENSLAFVYVSLIIKPNKHVEIRNPGSFKESLLIEFLDNPIPIRRIIPGQPGSKNPKLADVLKVFDKWEGRGIGMATLTNECLKNNIDLPYYRFHGDNELSLIIPKGHLLDDDMNLLFESYQRFIDDLLEGEELSQQHKLVLAYLYKSEIENSNYRYTILLTTDNNHLDAIRFLEKHQLIFKHELSPKRNPIFMVHRQFMRHNYFAELRKMFGNDFYQIESMRKKILDVVYLYTHFSKSKTVSAKKTGNILYYRGHKIYDIKLHENYLTKVRYRFNKLEKEGFIIKQSYGQYVLNEAYLQTKPASLFS
ncbi:MAG: hypothetical protein B6242_01705 [Anaerolineaceae bacterium 4572_78]|nr:MAG: hypothetical protein B6242_01705 [Anaerolineaceae bacterium 4572_78]